MSRSDFEFFHSLPDLVGIIRTYKSKTVFRLENSDLRLLWKSSSVNCIDDDKVPFICIDKKEIEFLI